MDLMYEIRRKERRVESNERIRITRQTKEEEVIKKRADDVKKNA